MTFISGALVPATAARTIIHEYDSAAYNPGLYATILSRTVPVAKTWYLQQVHFSAPCTGTYRVKINGNIKLIHNTSPAELGLSLKLENALTIGAGEVLLVEFCARDNAFAGNSYSFIHGYQI